MSGKEFDSLIQMLRDDGWKKSGFHYRYDDFYFYKGYEEYENKYGETVHRYQILVLFYDWRKYKKDIMVEDNETSVSVIVMPLDLLDDGKVDLELSRFDGITKVERIAKEYYEWVRRNFKCLDR